jgi:hypothetical protein
LDFKEGHEFGGDPQIFNELRDIFGVEDEEIPKKENIFQVLKE